jgi:peptidoglycan/LPS O-acetylase OafA/YrhL
LTGALISLREREIKPDDSPDSRRSAAGLVLILLSIFLTDPQNNFPGWQALFATAGAALVISGHQGSFGGKLLSSRWLVYFGLISYPLYLWHWPVLSFLKITTFNPGTVANLVAVAASVLLAMLTYSLIEKCQLRGADPAHPDGHRRLQRRQHLSTGRHEFPRGQFQRLCQ